MERARIIPCLLLKGGGLVKTVRFKSPTYVGDPRNAIKIFNEKEVDELVVLDIEATRNARSPDFDLISELAGECFMPMAYGGGVRTAEEARRLTGIGAEKVVLNTAACENPRLLGEISGAIGAQSVVASIDVLRDARGKLTVFTKAGTRSTGLAPEAHARAMQEAGAGEILLTSIDRDGTMTGYDLELLRRVSDAVTIPVIASGGAGSLQDMKRAIHEGGASAAAAGSFFVFHGPHRAVLISYPKPEELKEVFA